MDRTAFLAFIDGLPEAERNEIYAHPEKFIDFARWRLDTEIWVDLFGYMTAFNPNFNRTQFPPVDDGDEVKECTINGVLTGRQALEEFKKLKLEPASLGAQGRYLKAYPKVQQEGILLGFDTQRPDVQSDWVLMFFSDGGRPVVNLGTLKMKYGANCRWLLRAIKKV